MRFTIYIPNQLGGPLGDVINGSAIVGRTLEGGEQVLVDFEGNKYEAQNLRTFGDRAYHAASRQVEGYPTIARMVVAPKHLREVGTFDFEGDGNIEIAPESQALVTEWLGMAGTSEIPAGELRRSALVMAGGGEDATA